MASVSLSGIGDDIMGLITFLEKTNVNNLCIGNFMKTAKINKTKQKKIMKDVFNKYVLLWSEVAMAIRGGVAS